MSTARDDDIVCLTTASTPFQAHVWEQALRKEGIRCKVVGDYLDAAVGDIPGMRAEIWVHRDDLARAELILHESQNRAGEEKEEESEA